jgi:hypothetical protein
MEAEGWQGGEGGAEGKGGWETQKVSSGRGRRGGMPLIEPPLCPPLKAVVDGIPAAWQVKFSSSLVKSDN